MSVELYGIRFLNGDYADLTEMLAHAKGPQLIVVPSGPVLSEVDRDPETYSSLRSADVAIPDSGFMLLFLRLFKRTRLPKYSGYKLLGDLLSDPSFCSSRILLVDPDPESSRRNVDYLCGLGVDPKKVSSYVAPMYGKRERLADHDLNALIRSEQPDFIVINLGGMTQERLGASIKQAVVHDCTIVCTGAAIAFYTGQQAPISNLIDRLYLGWLWRCIYAPRTYAPRFFSAAVRLPLFLVRTPWKSDA